MSESAVKQELLTLSEKIVDLSEELDRLKEAGDESGYAVITKQLRDIGDHLIDYTRITQGDDLAYTHFSLGSLCSILGYYQQAEISYRKALLHWPDHVGLLNELFDCLMDQNKYADAKVVIEKSIKYGGETPVILQNYAVVLSHLEKHDQAKITLFNCMAKFPQDQRTRELLNTLEGEG